MVRLRVRPLREPAVTGHTCFAARWQRQQKKGDAQSRRRTTTPNASSQITNEQYATHKTIAEQDSRSRLAYQIVVRKPEDRLGLSAAGRETRLTDRRPVGSSERCVLQCVGGPSRALGARSGAEGGGGGAAFRRHAAVELATQPLHRGGPKALKSVNHLQAVNQTFACRS
eukprot:5194619-Pleurochrysis_carterae.AAC.2